MLDAQELVSPSTTSTRDPVETTALVWARLPHAGLGNMLFVWARALVFARLNGLPLLTSGWSRIHLGPILRCERQWRFYGRYFRALDSVPWSLKWLARFGSAHITEPEVALLDSPPGSNRVYVFSRIPHWRDYFGSFREQRDLVRVSLLQMLQAKHQERLQQLARPWIGVHIRRGDFRLLRPGEDFSKVGLVRTPLDYFIDLIAGVRQIHGRDLPVMVFSDGHDHELEAVLRLSGVGRAPRQPDVLDLLLLARSRLIIASAGSTFSYWAGFLADAPLLLHPDHIHAPLRPADVNQQYFEGGVRGPAAGWPALLKQNIRAIDMTSTANR